MSSPLDHNLSPGNVARTVYDKNSDSIRVNLVGTGSPTTPSIVQLSNGVNLLTSTTIGSDIGLDVNVLNNLELTISHVDDSIRLGDGTNLTTTTTVGSKVGLDVNVVNNSIASTPSIANVPMATANTEYNYIIPANTKKVMIKTRNSSLLKFAFVAGTSGTTYISVSPGGTYTLDDILSSSSITLYFQSTKSSETLEIIQWS